MTYITRDSGKRDEFSTGAKRDTQEGKPRYELIPVGPHKRLAQLYARGAEKYGERNWQKGMPFMRVFASLLRHAYQWLEGDCNEDHLAAVAWNAFALMAYQEAIGSLLLPPELDDRPLVQTDEGDTITWPPQVTFQASVTDVPPGPKGGVTSGAWDGMLRYVGPHPTEVEKATAPFIDNRVGATS